MSDNTKSASSSQVSLDAPMSSKMAKAPVILDTHSSGSVNKGLPHAASDFSGQSAQEILFQQGQPFQALLLDQTQKRSSSWPNGLTTGSSPLLQQ